MLGVLVINSNCKNKINSGNHDIMMVKLSEWRALRVLLRRCQFIKVIQKKTRGPRGNRCGNNKVVELTSKFNIMEQISGKNISGNKSGSKQDATYGNNISGNKSGTQQDATSPSLQMNS